MRGDPDGPPAPLLPEAEGLCGGNLRLYPTYQRRARELRRAGFRFYLTARGGRGLRCASFLLLPGYTQELCFPVLALDYHSAVGAEQLAGDERCTRGRKKKDGLGCLLRRSDAA